MDGADLVDRYKRYKSGTTKIFDYIIAATRNLPEFASILPSVHAANKAVKQAKKRPERISAADVQVTVTTSKLVKLAELVVKHRTPVSGSIITLLTDVIRGRKESAGWYAAVDGSIGSPLHEQHKSHKYFICILEQVKELLLPLIEKSDNPNQHKDQPSETGPAFENIFASLNIEEPSESPFGTEPATKQLKVSFKFEAPDQEEEKTFALWCFLQDLDELRQNLKKVWEDYAAGHTTFAAASFTTETGFAIMRHMDDLFRESYPEFQDFGAIFDWMNMKMSRIGQTCLVHPARLENMKTPVIHSSQESSNSIGELFCPHAFLTLRAFLCSFGLDYEEMIKNEDIVVQLVAHNFGMVLTSVKMDLETVIKHNVEDLYPDLFLRGLFELALSQSYCPWLVFACQVYIDIYDLVDGQQMPGSEEVQKQIRQAQSNYKLFQGMPGRAKFDDYQGPRQTISDCFDHTMDFVNACLEDKIQEAYSATNRESTAHNADPRQKHQLRNIMPLYAASAAFKILEATHINGVLLCNNNDLVLSAAYLYRACVQSGYLEDSSWPDMDFVISSHSEEKPLVLERERDIKTMGKFFGMRLGLSISAYANGHNAVLPKRIVSKEQIEPTFPLFKVHKEQCVASQKRSPAGYKEKVAAAIRCANRVTRENSGSGQNSLGKSSTKRNASSTASFAPPQMLEASQKAFKTWETDLNFNYTAFYISCLELLRNIGRACHDYFERNQPRAALRWNQHLTDLVYAILMDAANDEIDVQGRSRSPALSIASKHLRHHVKLHGRKFYDAAVTQSTSEGLVDQSVNNPELLFEQDGSAIFSKLLHQWDCPTFGKPRTVFCRSMAEIERQTDVGAAVIKMGIPSKIGTTTKISYSYDTSELLKVLEPSAAIAVRRMSAAEEAENLVLFIVSFLCDVDNYRVHGGEIMAFLGRVYSPAVQQQVLKNGEFEMPKEVGTALARVIGLR